jgi:polar amino acid transport system permease protein
MFIKAARLTVTLAFWGIAFSAILGLFCALIRYWRIPFLKILVGIYIELARNTPLMIQLFFLYYGLPRLGLLLEGETCAIVGMTFLGGAYMAEAFRGGLSAISHTQIEMGMSLGLRQFQVLRYIILPQAMSVALPALTATSIFLIKETSVFSIVALPDLMYVAKDLLKEGHSTESNLMLVLSYLVIIFPVSLFFAWLERRSRYAGFGN